MFDTSHWFNAPNLALFLTDPLNETTRKERTSLMVAATIGIMVAHMGIVPNAISVLGIEFTAKEKIAWWIILAAIILYHLAAFCLYWITDYVAWRRAARADLVRKEYELLVPKDPAKPKPPLGANAAILGKIGDQYATPYRVESRLWNLRCWFDMLFPTALGVYSVIALLWLGLGNST